MRTIKTAVELEGNSLQDLDLSPLDVNMVSTFMCASMKISRFLQFSKNFMW